MRRMLGAGVALLAMTGAAAAQAPIVRYQYGGTDGAPYGGPAPVYRFQPGYAAGEPPASGPPPTVTYSYGGDGSAGTAIQMQPQQNAQAATTPQQAQPQARPQAQPQRSVGRPAVRGSDHG